MSKPAEEEAQLARAAEAQSEYMLWTSLLSNMDEFWSEVGFVTGEQYRYLQLDNDSVDSAARAMDSDLTLS